MINIPSIHLKNSAVIVSEHQTLGFASDITMHLRMYLGKYRNILPKSRSDISIFQHGSYTVIINYPEHWLHEFQPVSGITSNKEVKYLINLLTPQIGKGFVDPLDPNTVIKRFMIVPFTLPFPQYPFETKASDMGVTTKLHLYRDFYDYQCIWDYKSIIDIKDLMDEIDFIPDYNPDKNVESNRVKVIFEVGHIRDAHVTHKTKNKSSYFDLSAYNPARNLSKFEIIVKQIMRKRVISLKLSPAIDNIEVMSKYHLFYINIVWIDQVTEALSKNWTLEYLSLEYWYEHWTIPILISLRNQHNLRYLKLRTVKSKYSSSSSSTHDHSSELETSENSTYWSWSKKSSFIDDTYGFIKEFKTLHLGLTIETVFDDRQFFQ